MTIDRASIAKINPATDDEVADMVSPRTRADLAERIMMTSPGEAAQVGRSAPPSRMSKMFGLPRSLTRRLRPVGLLIVAATASTAVIALSSGEPGRKVGPVPVGPDQAGAAVLSFEPRGRYLIVKVQDPVADPIRYRKEFAARGLDIDLSLKPVSPRKAGTVVFMEDDGRIETITAKGRCGTRVCPVGIKVPLNHKGPVIVVFGRAARPGETYETGPGDAPGEGVGLPDVRGRTVAEVLAMPRTREAKVEYRYEYRGSDRPYPNGIPAEKVRRDWYVHDAVVGSEEQIILFVGPEPKG